MSAAARILALLLLAFAAGARAADAEFAVSAAETEAAKLLDQGRFTLAKEKARALLAGDPNSFAALYVLGAAHLRSDGNLPKARYFLERARSLLERRWPPPMPPSAPWQWHARTLRELVAVTAEMDDREEELRILALRDELYTPKMTATYGWPLMKLGRMAEGRRKLGEALAGKDADERLTALNTLGAIENESGNREAAYEVFKRLAGEAEAQKSTDPVFQRNWGNTALALQRYEEAERLFLESGRNFLPGTFTNPWEDLAHLYLAEGRFAESLSAARKMQAWAHRNLASVDQQSWAGRQTVVASILAECGYIAEAEALAREVRERPDRRGGSSGQQGQDEAGNLVLYQYILRLRGEVLAEDASFAPAKAWPRIAWARAKNSAAAWAARERAAALTLGNGWLRASLRPFCFNGVDVAVWALPEFVAVAGAGVVGEEVRVLLASTYADKEREEPFLRLLLGESLVRRGRASGRAELERAVAGLPKPEVLLRARAEAMLGRACEDGGDFAGAVRHFQEALLRHPGSIRALGLALPVRIEAAGGESALRAAALLRRSPRFSDRSAGFRLTVSQRGASLSATLSSPDGSLIATASVPGAKVPSDTPRELCREFHRRAFAARVDLAQTDIASLQGSNLTGEAVRDQLKDLFGAGDRPPK